MQSLQGVKNVGKQFFRFDKVQNKNIGSQTNPGVDEVMNAVTDTTGSTTENCMGIDATAA